MVNKKDTIIYNDQKINNVYTISYKIKKHAYLSHKKIINYVYKSKHRRLGYIHVILLLLVICGYNCLTFNRADDLNIPTEEVNIVVENEPQLLPDQAAEEVIPEIEISEELSGEIATGTSDEEQGTSTGIIMTGETITGEILSGVHIVLDDEEFFSGVINSLSGETLYNLSGEIIGEVVIESGEILPVDLSGTSLLPQPLSVIYPTQQIQLNASGYLVLDTLNSVTTTGGILGANYCSRIAYENLTSVLKAGIWTWRETNDYLVQGDAEDLVIQGLNENTLLEVTSGEIKNIFSGENGTVYGFVYDVYASFVDNENTVYHRITVVYADDPAASDGAGGQRYVLDPLRGARTSAPQKFSDYLAYYDDETDVRRYLGQAYSPSVIKEKNTSKNDMQEILHEFLLIEESDILSGEIFSGAEEISGNILEEIFTGEITSGVVETTTGEILPEEIVSENTGEIVIPSTPGADNTETITTGTTEIVTGEEITAVYFTKAYERGEYSEKIIQLQNLLTWLELYAGEIDGIYSDAVIESLYQYQLLENILTPQDSIGLRGYMGPSTRIALNQSYGEYQNTLEQENISIGQTTTEDITTETGGLLTGGISTLEEIGTISGLNIFDMFNPFFEVPTFSGLNIRLSECQNDDMICKKKITEKLLKEKGYTLSDKGLVQLSQDALIGSDTLDMDMLDGEVVTDIVMQSTNELSGNIAEVQIPEDTIVVIENGDIFTGEILAPIFLDIETISDLVTYDMIAAVDVGTDEKIQFKNEEGDAMFVTFRIPAPGMQEGDTLDIYYSQDGETQQYLTDIEVQLIDGEPYAIFEADHFTQFYLGDTTGTFVINNDDAYTTGLAVTLNSNVTGATHMRFGNTIAERDLASWVSYATGYAWNLTGLYSGEVKWVYAQFSGNGVMRNVSDSIVYDINSGVNTSGLQLHLNASTGGTRFYDVGPRNLFFTGINGTYKSTWSGEEIMVTDGVNDYIEGTSGFITNYPFTISAWVKPSRVGVIQTLVMFGNSATNTTSYGIRLLATGAPSAVAQNKTARTATSTTILQADKRYHIIGVFNSSTSRTIYVDNSNPVTNGQKATFSATNQRRRIARHPGLSTTNYYSGAIDEVRVYNKALTAEERQAIFMVPPTFDTQTAFTGTPTLYGSLGDKMLLPTLVISGTTYSTTGAGDGKWKTLPMITGIANGTYNVTLNYTSVYGKTGTTIYTSGLTINATGITVTYNPSLATTGSVVATLTGLDATYMIVNNSGSEVYTFTGNGSFTWEYVDKQGTTGSTTATVDRIKDTVLAYSTGIFYEDSLLNNGSIGSTISVVLSSGSFSTNATGYITLSNVPVGLTGVYTLSGTNTIIISLSGNASNHAAINSTGIVINFLTGAFVEFTPSQVVNSENIELFVQFVDAPDYFPGQQLRINGYLSGGQFYDWSPNHRPTTGTNMTTALQGSETYMSFNNATSYVDIGSYTLPNYTITARFRLNSFGTYDTLVGNGNPAVTTYELIDVYQNKITFYAHSQLQSTFTINAGERYHVALVQGSTGTSMYINGVFNTSTATRRELANAALAVGADLYYTSQARDGGIDEVKIYDSPLTSTQIENLYMVKPSFTPKETQVASPNLRGIVYDPQMDISLTISGITYPATNNQNGTWQILAAGPFASGTYDVQLNYTNVYGKTGMIYYTGGLTVDPQIHIDYNPATLTSGNVIATVTGYNEFATITNNGGSPDYTFTGNGQFTFELYNATSGNTASITAIVDWIRNASLSYSSDHFYENSGLNDGSITGNIIVTITDDTFSSNIITSGLVQMTNIPAGLTGVFTLSGTTQLIIGLTGNATYHTNDDDIYNVGINFLTGAFTTYTPDQVRQSSKNNIDIDFFDGSAGTGFLWLDGSYSGVNFYDLSAHHITTGTSMTTTTQSGEQVMSFNGTTSYIDIGTYTLPEYTMSSRIYRDNTSTSFQSIIARNGAGTSFEISVYNNLIDVYFNSRLQSTFTIGSGQWYHIVVTKDQVGTKLFINGELNNSNTFTGELTATALAVGRRGTSQYRPGDIDEVRIFESALTTTQVKDLYMKKPSYTSKTIYTGTTTLTGLVNDPKMYSVSLLISGTTYTGTLQSGARTTSSIGPLANGTYDVQLNYMNVYGKTGTIFYTGGLQVIDLSYPIASVEYNPTTDTTGNVIATLTGFNKTGITVTNNGGLETYTFTGNGSFIFELIDEDLNTGEVEATVTWIKSAVLSYSTGIFYEDSGVNNGSITGNIVATLSTGAFSGAVADYVTLTNIPAGLTGVFTLSGTQDLLITLSGNAIDHTVEFNVSDITLTFLTGAFSGMNPSDIINTSLTGIAIEFVNPPGYITGQQLRVNGSLSGGQFYDRSPNHRITTGYGGISNSSRSGETVMGPFNGTTQYVSVGTYTLPVYTVSAWFKASVVDNNRRTILGDDVANWELSLSGDKLIELYNDATRDIASTQTILADTWYHVAMVKTSTGTNMYINGVLETSIASTAGFNNSNLYIGAALGWPGQERSGNIDEVKLYDTPLSATQIENMYMTKPSFVATTGTTSTPTLIGLSADTQMTLSLTISGTTYPVTNNQDGTRTSSGGVGPLTNGTYDVQLNYLNVYGKTGMLYYTGGLVIDILTTGSLSITGPASFDFSGRDASEQAFTIEKTFSGASDYFQLDDQLGYDTGYYTTISISDMTNTSGDSIPYTAIATKALTGIVTLSGTDNPRVYSAITGTYQYFTASPLTFISRDTAANGGVRGTYGLHTVWKVDVPALQNVGEYTGLITYTLY